MSLFFVPSINPFLGLPEIIFASPNMADFYQELRTWLYTIDNDESWTSFKASLAYWKKSPYPFEEFYAEAKPLFQGDEGKYESFKTWVTDEFKMTIRRSE